MTTQQIRPMLAVTAAYPLPWGPPGFWIQPKFDGFRCMVDPVAGPVTRTGAPIKNRHVREALSDPALIGLDGELTAPGGLEAAQSAFSADRPPPPGWRFTAFDDLTAFSRPFSDRLARLRRRGEGLPPWARVSPARLARGPDDLTATYAALLDDHDRQDPTTDLDGFCLRRADRPYHEGKASAVRGELFKVKPMSEGEAILLDVAGRGDDPHAIGAVQVRHCGRAFWAPFGMPRDLARALWRDRDGLPGAAVTLRSWGTTGHDLPRHAVAVAIRRDLDG